jgi:hypothetical protein
MFEQLKAYLMIPKHHNTLLQIMNQRTPIHTRKKDHMAEDDECVVSALVVELDPETRSPRNLIIPRFSVGAPSDRDGTTGPG